MVDAQGAVTLGREYDPFGGLITDIGTVTTNYGFAGEEQDPNTEQLYLRARTYAPNTGRFLQQDSVLGQTNQPRTLHRYTYAFNNPINYTDPTGHTGENSNTPQTPLNYNNGGDSGPQGGNSPYTPGNNPARSANNGKPATYSDPHARDKSRGFLPSLCGLMQSVQAAVDTAGDIAQEVLAVTKPVQDLIDPLQERLYNAIKDTTFIQELQREGRERPLESLVISVLADIVVDVASFALGHDILTGEKLSHGMELLTFAAIFVPAVAAGVLRQGDNVARAGSQLSRHADELGEGAEFAARYTDELGEAAQMATRHSDELLDAAKWSARHSDDLPDAQHIARRLDDWVSRSDETAEAAHLQRRLDDWVGQSSDTARYADNVAETRYADDLSESRGADGYGGSCTIPTRNSFTAGTPVETEDGAKPIETIREGDKVLGEDPETGEQGYYEVVSVRSHFKDEIVEVTIETDEGEETTQEVMETTPDHPVYVEDKGWMWAENLEPGDRLRTAEDTWAEVVSIEHVQLDEPELVYNFTVRGPHTYFVLETAVLVHNEGTCIWNAHSQRWHDSETGQFVSWENATKQEIEPSYHYDETLGHRWSDGGIKYGRMSPEQVEALRKHVGETGEEITIVGGWAETELGVSNRVNALQVFGYEQPSPKYGIPGWRNTGAPSSGLPNADPDLDIWAPDPLSDEALSLLRENFDNPDKIDNYQNFANWVSEKPWGAITFRKMENGEVTIERTWAPWQQYPSALTPEIKQRAATMPPG